MSCSKSIVLALEPVGKTGKAAALPERIKAVKAPGKKLMRIALMTDVEKQLIVREIKQFMQNQRRFHKTEIGTEMSAGLRHGVNDLRAYLGGKRV